MRLTWTDRAIALQERTRITSDQAVETVLIIMYCYQNSLTLHRCVGLSREQSRSIRPP
jgi:hypothetical protein